jgi:hypothetical protein
MWKLTKNFKYQNAIFQKCGNYLKLHRGVFAYPNSTPEDLMQWSEAKMKKTVPQLLGPHTFQSYNIYIVL